MSAEANGVATRAAAGEQEFQCSEAYRRYVVWFLFVVYVFNFVDRQILATLMELIKRDFALTDTQLGLLSGLAFAAFYTTVGIPIARLADKSNRVNIIAASLLIWSAATAATALAKNFMHLFLCRIVVGIGEAGCSPPAHSLISDYFEPKRRATALSIYSMGVYGGSFLGLLVGGVVAQEYGWRTAFLLVGLPGLLLAVIMKLTLREPPRGFSEGGVHAVREPPPMLTVLRTLWGKRTFKHLSVASGLHAFVSYGVSAFYNSYLIRSHGFTVAEAGIWLAFIVGIGGLSGTYFGGTWADKLSQKHNDSRYLLKVPAVSNLIALPFAAAAFMMGNTTLVLICLFIYVCFGTMYLAPSISGTYKLVGPRERALASALLFLVLNFIGMGIGPTLTGLVSESFRGYFIDLGATEAQATADGLRYALSFIVFVFLWSTFHYYRAMRTLREEEYG
ncbi:spinster family MFS transporter [Povalibacter sp.]|uniref:spinster family MFS transporter n=1 Tax=Povalibacter sp. TaxID=1962978 RepID=UPI002D1FBD9E|nr:MFS transporter [Povalibacter sp.]